MKMKLIRSIASLVSIATVTVLAQSGPGPSSGGQNGGQNVVRQLSLFTPSETAPAGGVAQMKFMVTEPTPVSTGGPNFAYDSSICDAIWGIELFNSAGDLNGVAMLNGNAVKIQYITTTGAQGTDYPIMTVALHIRPDAVVGSQTHFSLDPSSTWVLGSLGSTTLKPTPPATITVGGSVSITNVVPGGGILPAGAVVSIQGIGFQPKTQVQLNAIKASSIQLVSPHEIQFTLAAATNMTGQKIQVVNPDGSQDIYFSYLRGVPVGWSNQPLLANAVPVFSSMTHSVAVFNPVMPTSAAQFTGVAIQNPGLSDTQVTVALYSSTNILLGTSTMVLPYGARIMREISELTQGAAPTFGSYVVVTSSQPVQVFGFVGDNTAGTVSPFAAIVSRP
jgi:hypothetical protein